MARSSSAQKISRLAAKGKGRTMRVRGGNVFPTAVLLVSLLGVVLVAYARQTTVPVDVTDVAPGRYSTAFGVYVCDAWVELPGPADPEALDTDAAIRIDGPGVLSWKPQVLAGERRARLGTIFETLGMTVTDDSITLPAEWGAQSPITEADSTCGDGEPATLSVTVWEDAVASEQGKVSIASLNGVRLTGDRMAIALAFTPTGSAVPIPASYDLLPDFQSEE